MNFLTKNIISRGDNFFALDLSDLSIKIFQLERDGKKDKVRSFASLDVPKGIIEDGRIIDKSKTAELIKLAVRKARPKKIKTRRVVCSLPESKAFLRIITIPKMDEKDAAEAIKWEIEASIPLSVDNVYFDWQFLGSIGNKQDVLTVAVSKEVVDDLVETIKIAGFETYGLEVESVASVRSLIPSQISNADISLIVDLGAKRTSFIIAEGNIPYFTSSIPFSSEVISESICKSLGISREKAEEIKRFQGIEHSLESNSIFEAIKPLLENLSVEIEKTIDFYHSLSKESREVKKIIICGGGSNLKGLIPYLTTRLSREIVAGDAWVNLNLGDNLPIIDKDSSVRYATAIGLALKEINYGNKN